jgi:hypothetical protein
VSVYAGIGSRQTPKLILDFIKLFAMRLGDMGWQLRSGGAMGADIAFERGARASRMGDQPIIYRPEDATDKAIELASRYHPNWQACDEYARKLHGRNAMIVLGQALNYPVNKVVCWTRDGRTDGGTGMGIRIAMDYKIPIVNMGSPEGWDSAVRVFKEGK